MKAVAHLQPHQSVSGGDQAERIDG